MAKSSTETTFEDQGSLEKPRLIGRLVRFTLGVFLLYLMTSMILNISWLLKNGIPLFALNILFMVGALWVVPYVVNIGWALNSKRLPQLTIIGLSLLFGTLDYLTLGVIYGPSLKVFTLAWVFYTISHLGISMFLAGIVASPGCEMRAIPYLWARLSGQKTREHYCPSLLNTLDRWERGRDSRSKMQK